MYKLPVKYSSELLEINKLISSDLSLTNDKRSRVSLYFLLKNQ